MTRSLSMLTLAMIVVAACSPSSPPDSAAAGKDATAAAPASSAPPSSATPAQAAPAAEPADQTKPAAVAGAAPTSGSNAARPSTPAAEQPSASAAAAPPVPVPPPPPPEPPAPKFHEVTVPAGTQLNVTVLSTLASNTSKVEDPVKGSLAKAVVVSGATAIPSGSAITGSVTDVSESGRVKGKASIAFRFDRLVVRGETYRIQTARVTQEAAQDKKSDVKKGGVGAGLGAVVGGVIGGGKGAAIGAVAGGTGAVLGTKGSEVQIAPGTAVAVLLQDPITMQVPIK